LSRGSSGSGSSELWDVYGVHGDQVHRGSDGRRDGAGELVARDDAV